MPSSAKGSCVVFRLERTFSTIQRFASCLLRAPQRSYSHERCRPAAQTERARTACWHSARPPTSTTPAQTHPSSPPLHSPCSRRSSYYQTRSKYAARCPRCQTTRPRTTPSSSPAKRPTHQIARASIRLQGRWIALNRIKLTFRQGRQRGHRIWQQSRRANPLHLHRRTRGILKRRQRDLMLQLFLR